MFQCFTLSQVEEIDICLSCNLLRLRTCADTILVLTEVADNVARLSAAASVASAAAPASSSSSRLSERQSTEDPQQVPDEVLPDLEDAMAELEVEAAANTAASKKAKPRRRGGDKGAQVFFFPNEGGNVKISLDNEEDEEVPDCMTQSVYLQSTGANNSSDDSLEESFFFVESVGTGTVGGSGEPTVRPLDDVVIVYDNHFAIPQKSINFLKTPKGFAR